MSHVHYFRDATGKFPDFPDKEEGGSAAIFKKREEVDPSTSKEVYAFCSKSHDS